MDEKKSLNENESINDITNQLISNRQMFKKLLMKQNRLILKKL